MNGSASLLDAFISKVFSIAWLLSLGVLSVLFNSIMHKSASRGARLTMDNFFWMWSRHDSR